MSEHKLLQTIELLWDRQNDERLALIIFDDGTIKFTDATGVPAGAGAGVQGQPVHALAILFSWARYHCRYMSDSEIKTAINLVLRTVREEANPTPQNKSEVRND